MRLKFSISWLLNFPRAIILLKNWPVVVFDKMNIPNKKPFRQYNLRNGLKYLLWNEEFGILREIFLDKIYTPNGFVINKQDLVVDIGAHVGIFSIMAAKKAYKGKVYSIEPINKNFNLLIKNKYLNHINNITPLNFGLSNKNGFEKFFISERGTGSHSTFIKERGEEILIKTMSFNQFVKKYKIKKIDFLKIDCEGAEYKILPSISKKNFEKINKISIEVHNFNRLLNYNFIKNLLENNGFKVSVKPHGKKWHILYAINLSKLK